MMDTLGTAHQIKVDGTSIAWSEMGAGFPVVLLHGLGDSHRTWRRTAPRLARMFRVLMPDLPGQYVRTNQRAHEVKSLPAIALFWGADDSVIPVNHTASLLDRFTGITLATYPGCGHFPQLDTHSAFARDLVGFFSEPHRCPAVVRPQPKESTQQSACASPRDKWLRPVYRGRGNLSPLRLNSSVAKDGP